MAIHTKNVHPTPHPYNIIIARALKATGLYKVNHAGLFDVSFQDKKTGSNYSTYLILPEQTQEQDLINSIGLAEEHGKHVVPIFYKDGKQFFRLSVQNRKIPNELKHISQRDVFRMIDLNPLEKRILNESGKVDNSQNLVYFQPETRNLEEGISVFRMDAYRDDDETLKNRRLTTKLRPTEGQVLTVNPFKRNTATFVYK